MCYVLFQIMNSLPIIIRSKAVHIACHSAFLLNVLDFEVILASSLFFTPLNEVIPYTIYNIRCP